jgi:hypothetical protein
MIILLLTEVEVFKELPLFIYLFIYLFIFLIEEIPLYNGMFMISLNKLYVLNFSMSLP